jgi:oligopeptide/dipeptide ABC transporter ATP-binding protein
MIMYLGSVAEIGPTDAVLTHPKHPYTQLLVAAAPVPDPAHPAAEIAAPEQVPTPIGPGRGCPFKDRCPQVMPMCHSTVPPLSFVGPNHQAACHLYGPVH